jgi:hypothetical protein
MGNFWCLAGIELVFKRLKYLILFEWKRNLLTFLLTLAAFSDDAQCSTMRC